MRSEFNYREGFGHTGYGPYLTRNRIEELEWEGAVNPGNRDYIAWLQSSLNQIMGLRLAADGNLGTQTRSAIRSFQEKNGLPPDGIVGLPTEAALIAASKGPALRTQDQDTASEFEAFDEDSLTDDFAETWQGEVSAKDPRDRYVQWMQKSLNNILKLKLLDDGQIGSKTLTALQKFQRLRSLTKSASGLICPATATEKALIKEGGIPLPDIKEVPVQEIIPPGRTIYADIPLQVPLGEAKSPTGIKARSMTGIFIPENYCVLEKVDLIVFLPGFKWRDHKPWWSIDEYWSSCLFRLREEVHKSQKNVILVAPTLGPQSEPGSLTCPGGFDNFLEKVMMALKPYGLYKGKTITSELENIGNIILACHSGSAQFMLAITKGKDTSTTKIQECWAFEPASMGTAKDWEKWAQSPPTTKKLYIYYLFSDPASTPPEKQTVGQRLCHDLTGTDIRRQCRMVECKPNIFGEESVAIHDNVPEHYLKDRIQGAQFLVDKSKCQRSGTRQSISPIRKMFRWQEIPFDLSNESAGVGLPNNYWGEDVWQEEVPRIGPDYNKWVQQSLNQIMGLRLAMDGNLGPQTRSAIRSFQQKHGLAVDGKVGPNTEAAIKAAQAGAPAKPISFQYVKDFSGPAGECTDALKRAGKTRAEALTIVNTQIGVAIAMLRKAATDLKRGSRSSGTKDLFRKIFRVRPESVPNWLTQTPTIKDRGDVVATRCKRVADLLERGGIRYFCTISQQNCPDCRDGQDYSTTYACSSWGDESAAPQNSRVICLNAPFWDAMGATPMDVSTILAVLMHEPFHIFYGTYVTSHDRANPGKFGGIYCIQQFVFETNSRMTPDWVNQWCVNTAVRKELEFPL